jgi:hypothetical protein
MVHSWNQQPVWIGVSAGNPLVRRGVELQFAWLISGYNEAGVEDDA